MKHRIYNNYYCADVLSIYGSRFSFVDNDEVLRGVTCSFSRAINYIREANLSESIIIVACQNYVLTRASRCSRCYAVINYGNSIAFYHFLRLSGSVISCNIIRSVRIRLRPLMKRVIMPSFHSYRYPSE